MSLQTTSRAGWQSPQQETAISPKSDNYLYRHTVKSSASSTTASPRNMLRQSSYTLENNSQHLHHHHHHHNTNHVLQTHQNSNNQHNYHQPQIHSQYSNSGVDSTQQQFSKTIDLHKRTTINYSTTASSSSTSNEMLLEQNNKNPKYERIYSEPCIEPVLVKTAHEHEYKNVDKQFPIKCNYRGGKGTIIETSSSSSTASTNKYEHDIAITGKRDENKPEASSNAKLFAKQQITSEHRYGKIQLNNRNSDNFITVLPSSPVRRRSQPPLPTLPAPPTQPPPPLPSTFICSNNYDQYNANNIQFQSNCDMNASNNCINTYNNNNNNNNNHIKTATTTTTKQQSSTNNNNNAQNYSGNGNVTSYTKGTFSAKNGPVVVNGVTPASVTQRRTGNETNRNVLRTNRYSNGTHLTAPGGGGITSSNGQHQLAHMINSLSSPESAYSTGYSTDGTSPGIYFVMIYIFTLKKKIIDSPNR